MWHKCGLDPILLAAVVVFKSDSQYAMTTAEDYFSKSIAQQWGQTHMIKAEWRYLLGHKFILLVLIVIGFIPSIYAVTFLKSMWDPYGKLQDLPVAVVNHDQATTYQGTHLAAGKQLTHALTHSSAMAFKVMSARSATQALKNGQVYMVMTIPSNFSKNATTLLQTKPKKMVLQYATSAGHNYTASKMTASAAKTAADQVADQVTRTYAKTMFNSIKTLSNGITAAGQHNQQLATGSQKAVTADQQLTTGLNQLVASTLTFRDGTNQLVTGLNHYLSGVDQATSGSRTLSQGVKTYTNGVNTASTAAQQLATGSQTLQAGTQRVVSGVGRTAVGAQQLSQNLTELTQKTGQLSGGTARLATASQQLSRGMQQLTMGGQQLTTGLDQLQLAVNQQAKDPILSRQVSQLAATLSQHGSAAQLAAIKTAINQVEAATTKPATDNRLAAKVAATADAEKLTATQKQAILATINGAQPTQSTELTAALQQLTQAAAALPSDHTTQATTELQALKQALQTTANNQQALATKLATVTNGAQTLTSQLQAATTGFQTLDQGVQVLATQTPKLVTGTQALSAGATGLATGTTQLAQASTGLGQGSGQLATGAQQLALGTQKLSRSGASLTQGAETLTAGLTTLTQQKSALLNGTGQLTAGTAQLATGGQRLAQGGNQLATGLDQVQQGNQQLATKLTAAGKQASVRPTNLTYDQLAKPTTTKASDADDAQNNGTGMAPYMMSVSLFVGALAFNMMFDMYTPRKYPKSGFHWWTGKGSILLAFALSEAVLIEGLLILIDGLAPIHPWATFGVLVSIAVAFMSIVYWLNLVFGKVGAFFSMILLVLQLGGSAGTYPIQLSNHFFQTIHPWLPMSYAVSGLRNTLMVGNSAWPQIGVLIGIGVLFSIFSMLFYGRRHGRVKAIDFEDAD